FNARSIAARIKSTLATLPRLASINASMSEVRGSVTRLWKSLFRPTDAFLDEFWRRVISRISYVRLPLDRAYIVRTIWKSRQAAELGPWLSWPHSPNR